MTLKDKANIITEQAKAGKEKKMYRKDDIKKELEAQKAFYLAAVAEWEKVERKHKKDGKPFANMANNFDGCKITTKQFFADEKEATVYFRVGYKCESDSVDFTRYADENTPEDRIKPHEYYVKGKYDLNADEAEQAIKDHINRYKEYATEKAEQIAALDSVYEYAKEAMEAVHNRLVEATGSDRNSLYYAIEKALSLHYM